MLSAILPKVDDFNIQGKFMGSPLCYIIDQNQWKKDLVDMELTLLNSKNITKKTVERKSATVAVN